MFASEMGPTDHIQDKDFRATKMQRNSSSLSLCVFENFVQSPVRFETESLPFVTFVNDQHSRLTGKEDQPDGFFPAGDLAFFDRDCVAFGVDPGGEGFAGGPAGFTEEDVSAGREMFLPEGFEEVPLRAFV
jgi:hypothetical protein